MNDNTLDCSTLDCDVLIVGAGPAGLAVASTLPASIRSIIVHQDQEIGLPVRTSGGCWLQDAVALGIPEEMYIRISCCDVFADTEHARLNLGTAIPVILDTPRLYQWLAQQSDEKRRQLFCATKFLTTYRRDDGRYTSTIRSREHGTRQVVSTYIVDGSGWHCAVLSALGLVRKPQRLGVGTEYEYPLGRNPSDRAVLFMGQKALAGYGWAFPTPQGTLRVGVGIIQPDTNISPRDLLEAVINDKHYLDRLGLDLSGEPVAHGGILPSVRYEDRLVFGNVIRVGDSANFATPTVGEGIRLCIELGRVLGHELGRAVNSGASEPLRRYEQHCRRRLKRDFRWGFELNRRAARYSSTQWDASVRRMKHAGPDALVASLRCEFPLIKVARMAVKLLPAALHRRIGRLRARFAK